MEKRFCRFNARVTKAYINPETGLKTIEAVASDDKLDYYEERFSEESIDDMVYASRQRKELKPEEGLVGLQESHWEVFEIGYAVDGMKTENAKNQSKEYKVVLALKKDNWMADELYTDVKEKRIDKQLSVGGYIPDWEKDYEVVEETFVNEAGEDVEIQVGIIKRFTLEHIAVTCPDGAANPRTQFITAKSKGYESGSIFKSANDEAYQARFIKTKPEAIEPSTDKSFLKSVKDTVEETMLKVFKKREVEQMTNVEKAKKKLEELQKFIEDNPEELTDEVVKGLGVNFDVEDTDETPEAITEEVVKEKVDALEVAIDAKLEVIKALIPEAVEPVEVPEDQSEKVKALEALTVTQGEALVAMEARVKSMEDDDGDTNQDDDDGNTDDTEDNDEEDDEDTNVNKDKNDEYAMWA